MWVSTGLAFALLLSLAAATPTPTATPLHTPTQSPTPGPTAAVQIEPTSAQSTPAPKAAAGPSKVAFVSDRDGDNEIYLMDPDGTNQVQLTYNSALDDWPAWSPDGTKIAFQSLRDGNQEIYVMDADGSNQTRLTDNPKLDIEPAWSPNGTRIAFVSKSGAGSDEIYVMNADGSNPTRLTDNTDGDRTPAWSPDGTKIAFSSRPADRFQEIYVMNADGSNPNRLTDNFARDLGPVWSPDGSKIAFTSDRLGGLHMWVMNVDGTNPTRVTSGRGHHGGPTWSFVGSRIAFWSQSRDHPLEEIYVIDADGSGLTWLTSNENVDRQPAWSPITTLVLEPTPTPAGITPTPTPTAPPTIEGLELVAAALTEESEAPLAGVYVHGNHAYVGGQSTSYFGRQIKNGIRILDISDPANPQLVGRIPLRSRERFSRHSHGDAVVTHIETDAFRGDVVIVGHGVPDSISVPDSQPFGLWDVTDPSDPQFLSVLNLGKFNRNDTGGQLGDKQLDSKAVHGHHFYAIYNVAEVTHRGDWQNNKVQRVAAADLSDPRNPVVVGD